MCSVLMKSRSFTYAETAPIPAPISITGFSRGRYSSSASKRLVSYQFGFTRREMIRDDGTYSGFTAIMFSRTMTSCGRGFRVLMHPALRMVRIRSPAVMTERTRRRFLFMVNLYSLIV